MPELQSYKYIPYFPWFRIFIYRKAQISAPNFQRRDAWTLQLCLTSLLLALHHNFILKWLSCGSKTESQGREREFPLLPGIEGSRLPSRPLLWIPSELYLVWKFLVEDDGQVRRTSLCSFGSSFEKPARLLSISLALLGEMLHVHFFS